MSHTSTTADRASPTPTALRAALATPESGFVPHRTGVVQVPGDAAELRARIKVLLPEIAAGASHRERSRQLPYAWIRTLAEAGLFTLRIPRQHGGPGGTVRDLFELLLDIAAADSNIAQALRPGFGFVESLLAAGDAAQLQHWLPHLLDGEIFGNAGWERGGPNGQITARITQDSRTGQRHITGTKFYSTGALYADWVSSFALDDNGQETGFVVPRARPGLDLVDDFDAIGQHLTASGTTVFTQVEVQPQEIRPSMPRDRRSPLPPYYQLVLAAVEAGIARNALNDAIAFTREHARPIKHSTATRSVDDPYVQETVGQIAAQAYAAEGAVLRAALAIDAAWHAGLTQEALTTASIEVAQAQHFAVQAALKAAELVFDVAGATATLRTHNLDRHWRNARTVANHNPRQWKAAAVGNWLLTGTQPPTSGLF